LVQKVLETPFATVLMGGTLKGVQKPPPK